jgi:hypothetical protein
MDQNRQTTGTDQVIDRRGTAGGRQARGEPRRGAGAQLRQGNPVHEQVSLREEHVEVERRPVNQPLQAGRWVTRSRSAPSR